MQERSSGWTPPSDGRVWLALPGTQVSAVPATWTPSAFFPISVNSLGYMPLELSDDSEEFKTLILFF